MPKLPWPRSLRAAFSGGGFSYYVEGIKYDEATKKRRMYIRLWHKLSQPRMSFDDYVFYNKRGFTGGGRGTMEMKNNDQTNRFKEGDFGIACEMGRPSVGFYFRDLEKVSMALAKVGFELEMENPASILIDPKTGKIRDDYSEVRNERALSAIIEGIVHRDNLLDACKALEEVSKELDTVFSWSFINKCDENGIPPLMKILEDANIKVRINGKTNIGIMTDKQSRALTPEERKEIAQ